MANDSVKVAAAQLQRAASDIKGNIWATQRDFHDIQVRLRKEIDDANKEAHAIEVELARGAPMGDAAHIAMVRKVADLHKLVQTRQQELTDNERQANQVVHDKEAAAAELANEARTLSMKAGDPRFAL